MSKYYWKKVGQKADIERHRNDEADLKARIAKCEAAAAAGDRLSAVEAAAYRNCLQALQASKAEMASKLFKKKG